MDWLDRVDCPPDRRERALQMLRDIPNDIRDEYRPQTIDGRLHDAHAAVRARRYPLDMAGHSKWAGIKHKKAVVDARRGKLWAKLIRGVEVAAREGNTSNPDNDMTLAAAIDRAKSARVPSETIERAAKRGAGELGEDAPLRARPVRGVRAGRRRDHRRGADREPQPHGTGDPHHVHEGGSESGRAGFRRVDVRAARPDRHGAGVSEDDVLAAAAEAGADDLRQEDDQWHVVTDAKDLGRVRDALAGKGLGISSAELTMLPQSTVPLDADGARTVLRFLDALEELDDVQNVYTNFDIPDEVLAEVS